MADIIYTLEGGVYLNITNKCPCNCAFCIRSKGDAVGDAEKLWFDEEPTIEEIKKAIDDFDFTKVESAVFCGYGEPTNSYDNLVNAVKYIRSIN
ncbi:MAG: radical SAM protein, partial [Eubacterium sp.]|nr:radical SAM protein [Eubacterium sp.]